MEFTNKLTNNEILIQNKALIDTCISFQATKFNATHLIMDLKQDIYLIILEYPNDKLNRINSENHINAFVTGILRNQLYSSTSAFYRRYRKFSNLSDQLDAKLIDAKLSNTE